MVKYSYAEFEDQYKEILKAACGRQACSVLILIATEVDAMATTKMLTQMLRSDQIAHQIRPVTNFDEVATNIQGCLTSDIKTVFLINCGAIYDIPKYFDLEQGGDLRVYILDNHRPLHLKNIYSRHNVVVFDDDNEGEDDVPSEASDLESVSDQEEDGDMNSTEDEGMDEEDDFVDEEEELDPEEELVRGYGEDEEFEGDEAAEEEEEDVEEEEREAEEELDETMDLHAAEEEEEAEAKEEEDQSEMEEDEEIERPRQRRRLQTDQDETMIEGYEGEHEEGDDEDDQEGADMDISRITTDLHQPQHRQSHEEDSEDDEEEDMVVRRRSNRPVNPKKVKRDEISRYYRRVATYSWPTSLMLLPFAKAQLGANGHIPLDVMWQGVLGLTDQYLRGHIAEEKYDALCGELKVQLGEHLLSASDRVRYTVTNETNGTNGTTPASTGGVGNNNNNAATASGGNNIATEVDNANNLMISVQGCQHGHIEESSEYRFYLYRHWSLFEAMMHSTYMACKFPLHNGSRGVTKVQELLAEMGVPLNQCKQSYAFMNPEFREHFKHQLRNPMIVNKYSLSNPSVTYKSFCRFTSYKNRLSASDIVHAATALLELHSGDAMHIAHDEKKKSAHEAFYEPYELLGMRNDPLIKKGIKEALNIQRTIVKKAAAMLDGSDSIHRYHRIYYAYIRNNFSTASSSSGSSSVGSALMDEASNTANGSNPLPSNSNASSNAVAGSEVELVFGRPFVLAQLGQYIMEVKRNLLRKDGGWTGSQLLPLILLSERHDGTYLVMGISPFVTTNTNIDKDNEDNNKGRLAPLINFRQFFKLAAKDMMIPFRSNSFDPNVVEVRKEDAQDFLGALDNALKRATPQHFTSMANRTMGL